MFGGYTKWGRPFFHEKGQQSPALLYEIGSFYFNEGHGDPQSKKDKTKAEVMEM